MSAAEKMRLRHERYALLELVDIQIAERMAGEPTYRTAQVIRDLQGQRARVVSSLLEVGYYAEPLDDYAEVAM